MSNKINNKSEKISIRIPHKILKKIRHDFSAINDSQKILTILTAFESDSFICLTDLEKEQIAKHFGVEDWRNAKCKFILQCINNGLKELGRVNIVENDRYFELGKLYE